MVVHSTLCSTSTDTMPGCSTSSLGRIPWEPSWHVDLTCWYLLQHGAAVDGAGMDGYQFYGNWQKLEATQTTGSLTQESIVDIDFIILTVDPDHPENFPSFKRAIIPLDTGVGLSLNSLSTHLFFNNIPVSAKSHATDARGNLTFKDTHKLVNEGLCANWTEDRIVFYKSDYLAKDWVGFVRPFP